LPHFTPNSWIFSKQKTNLCLTFACAALQTFAKISLMLPETEQLLQKWLKIQIWQFRLMVARWIFIVIFFLVGVIGFFGFVLPALQTQVKKLDQIQSQLLNLPGLDQTSQQRQLLDELQKQSNSENQLFDLFLK